MVCSGAPYVCCGATVNTIAAVLAGTLAFGAPVFAVSFAARDASRVGIAERTPLVAHRLPLGSAGVRGRPTAPLFCRQRTAEQEAAEHRRHGGRRLVARAGPGSPEARPSNPKTVFPLIQVGRRRPPPVSAVHAESPELKKVAKLPATAVTTKIAQTSRATSTILRRM